MRKILLGLAVMTATFFGGLALASPAYAAQGILDPACNQDEGAGSGSAACGTNGNNPISGNNGVLLRISRILAVIAGIAAVIIMMAAGLVYITANGDASKVSAAKSTIIYAAVGLVVIGLGQAIITLVVNTIE